MKGTEEKDDGFPLKPAGMTDSPFGLPAHAWSVTNDDRAFPRTWGASGYEPTAGFIPWSKIFIAAAFFVITSSVMTTSLISA